MKLIYIIKIVFLLSLNFISPVHLLAQDYEKENSLSALIDATSKVNVIYKNKNEYTESVRRYREILSKVKSIKYETLNLNDQVDYDLLVSHIKTRIFEYDTIKLYTLQL